MCSGSCSILCSCARQLPDPLSALSQVKQAPDYLRPEATRPLAAAVHRQAASLWRQLPQPLIRGMLQMTQNANAHARSVLASLQ